MQAAQDIALIEQRHVAAGFALQLEAMFSYLTLGSAKEQSLHITTRAEVGYKITKEHLRTRQQIGEKIDALAQRTVESQRREAVLDSLFFPDFKARKESVDAAHTNTFKWIFEEQHSGSDHSWHDFGDWLRNGSTIYWIHGKAGSGKSTLCSFLDDHPDTNRLLKEWTTGMDLYHISFFFYVRAENDLQKTTQGLLRSLFYQLGHQDAAFIDDLHNMVEIRDNRVPSWTEDTLIQGLVKTLTKSSKMFFILIDGLDEFVGDSDKLVELCHDLQRLTNVKLCVSSRSQQPYRQAFAECAQLRL